MKIGTIVGSGVVFACALLFIGREYTEYEQIRAWCVVREIACRFSPGLVNRCAIYGFIGMVQVFLLFLIGLGVEERLRVREAGEARPPGTCGDPNVCDEQTSGRDRYLRQPPAYTRPSTSALFFEPNPRQLQSAASISTGRAAFGMKSRSHSGS